MSESKETVARISSILHRRVKIEAAKMGTSMKAWLDEAIKDKLQKRSPKVDAA